MGFYDGKGYYRDKFSGGYDAKGYWRNCGEGGFDTWEAVSVRQPPLPPPGGDFAIALGLALGKVY